MGKNKVQKNSPISSGLLTNIYGINKKELQILNNLIVNL